MSSRRHDRRHVREDRLTVELCCGPSPLSFHISAGVQHIAQFTTAALLTGVCPAPSHSYRESGKEVQTKSPSLLYVLHLGCLQSSSAVCKVGAAQVAHVNQAGGTGESVRGCGCGCKLYGSVCPPGREQFASQCGSRVWVLSWMEDTHCCVSS